MGRALRACAGVRLGVASAPLSGERSSAGRWGRKPLGPLRLSASPRDELRENKDRARVCPVSSFGPVGDYGRVMPATEPPMLFSELYRNWMTYFGLCVNAPGSLYEY